MADDYNPNDFEWRFQQSLKEHREKLAALSAEVRAELESELRERFREYEREDQALLDKGFDLANGPQRMVAQREAHDVYVKGFVDEAHQRQTEPEKDTHDTAWGRFQDRQKGADRDKEHER